MFKINHNPNAKIFEISNDIYIYDYEKIFTDEEKKILSKIIIKYIRRTKKEILVVTTPSIGDFPSMQDYATNIGSIYSNAVKNENVTTIVISKRLEEMAIATSPKARIILTDEIVAKIINEIIIPNIKKGNFFQGIKQGLYEIIRKWD